MAPSQGGTASFYSFSLISFTAGAICGAVVAAATLNSSARQRRGLSNHQYLKFLRSLAGCDVEPGPSCAAGHAWVTTERTPEPGMDVEENRMDAVDINNDSTASEKYVDVPEDAPEHCPGVTSEQAGKAEVCQGCPNQGICATGAAREDPSASEVKKRLAQVKKKVLVLSGKGGVGKSTVSVQLSFSLQEATAAVGLLDIDVCGPSIPLMTGCRGQDVHASADGWSPVYVSGGLAVMSIGFLLPNDDDAVIWRGPKKNGLIKQFLTDVTWGELDLLVVDTPPGTSDEHLSIVTYLSEAGVDGAIIVTTPQEVALQDVRKEINFCKKVGIPVLGVVENMTHSVFDPCRNSTKDMCNKMDVPYLGAVPLDRALVEASESGCAVKAVDAQSASAKALDSLTSRVARALQLESLQQQQQQAYAEGDIVLPVATMISSATVPSEGGCLLA